MASSLQRIFLYRSSFFVDSSSRFSVLFPANAESGFFRPDIIASSGS
jgi:hypothetical protein